MLRAIGRGPKKEDRSLLGRLLDCHERIREMTSLALRLGSDPRASEGEIAEAASRVHRYFSRSLPNHVRDEEESIAPRLARSIPAAARALDLMRDEHRDHEAHLERLLGSCETLASEPSKWSELRGELRHHAERLQSAFTAHLEAEERDVFPKIAELGPEAEAEILREMEARREGGGGRGAGRRDGAGRGGGGGRGRGR